MQNLPQINVTGNGNNVFVKYYGNDKSPVIEVKKRFSFKSIIPFLKLVLKIILLLLPMLLK